MNPFAELYRPSCALLTDFYQLTMAYAYWKSGKSDQEGVFHLSFRKNPFGGGFALAAGLEYVIDFLKRFSFSEDDLGYLEGLKASDGSPLFEKKFLEYLSHLEFECDVDAIPEGTVLFAPEPLLRISGPIIQCQLLETPLLNFINFQTLIATKAARVCLAAQGEPVMEFGLRRAQGIDGALTASRAAYLGGCHATSNVLAGKIFGIPVEGTHAHSWVMSFDHEIDSFRAFAEAMPNNCVFLVDTYQTIPGVERAIEVGLWLKSRGQRLHAIRLDSGDLAYLSIEARMRLDEAGLNDTKIIGTNDLDEHIIASLKEQHAAIGVWGVGTRLVTAYDQPALGGVYKLAAVRKSGENWQHRVKLSEQTSKISLPGIQQVRRYYSGREAICDVIFNEEDSLTGECLMIDPLDPTRRKKISPSVPFENLLVPIFRRGECVYQVPSLAQSRERGIVQLNKFHAGIKRFVNPHAYPVGLHDKLYSLRTQLVMQGRGLPS